MFDVLVPGKLVLTLRSTPPFVAESAFALALTILLAVPLIVRVYLLIVRAPDKLSRPSPTRGGIVKTGVKTLRWYISYRDSCGLK